MPATSTLGNTRLRIVAAYWSPPDACSYVDPGEYEDYTLVLTGPCSVTPGSTLASASSVCSGTTSSLSLSGNSGATSFQWQQSSDNTTFTDITGATNDTYMATLTAGTWYFQCVQSCPGSSGVSVATQVVVAPIVDPTATLTAPTSAFCFMQPAIFSVSGSNLGSAPSYNWYRNGVLFNTTATNSLDINISQVNPESISVVVTNIDATCASSPSVTTNTEVSQAQANPNPTIDNLSKKLTFCAGNPSDLVKLTLRKTTTGGQPINPTPVTCQWILNGVDIPGATDTTLVITSVGTYALRLTRTNTGCVKTSSNFVVTSVPTPLVNATALSATNFCQGGSVTLTTDSLQGYSIAWKSNNTLRSARKNYKVTNSGSYTATATVQGCSATSAPIVVNITVPADNSISVNGPLSVCSPQTVTLQAAVDPTYAYQWLSGSAPISGATNSSYIASTGGSYRANVTSPNCPARTTAIKSVIVSLPVTATVINQANNLPSSRTLRATGGSGLSYVWFKDNVVISGATTRDIVLTTNGSYKVTVTRGECSSTSSALMVSNLSRTGSSFVAESSEAVISVYPNPSDAIFMIGADRQVNIRVQDLQGRIILQQDNATMADLSAQAAGVYLMQITDASGTLLRVERIIKK